LLPLLLLVLSLLLVFSLSLSLAFFFFFFRFPLLSLSCPNPVSFSTNEDRRRLALSTLVVAESEVNESGDLDRDDDADGDGRDDANEFDFGDTATREDGGEFDINELDNPSEPANELDTGAVVGRAGVMAVVRGGERAAGADTFRGRAAGTGGDAGPTDCGGERAADADTCRGRAAGTGEDAAGDRAWGDSVGGELARVDAAAPASAPRRSASSLVVSEVAVGGDEPTRRLGSREVWVRAAGAEGGRGGWREGCAVYGRTGSVLRGGGFGSHSARWRAMEPGGTQRSQVSHLM